MSVIVEQFHSGSFSIFCLIGCWVFYIEIVIKVQKVQQGVPEKVWGQWSEGLKNS